MTIELFMFLFTIGSVASSLLTQAMKKSFNNLSSNFLALAAAFMVGLMGTCAAYILMNVNFTAQNVVCIGLMTVCIWVGSMVGYDKVLQMITQIKRG